MSATIDTLDWERFEVIDLGVRITGPFPPIARALHAVVQGVREGYPLCCVEEFAVDVLEGRHPGIRRGSVPTAAGGCYVPCTSCCAAIGREVIADA